MSTSFGCGLRAEMVTSPEQQLMLCELEACGIPGPGTRSAGQLTGQSHVKEMCVNFSTKPHNLIMVIAPLDVYHL
jgi:hypothetical protein